MHLMRSASLLVLLAVALPLAACTKDARRGAPRGEGVARTVGEAAVADEREEVATRRRTIKAMFRDVLDREPTAAELAAREEAVVAGIPLLDVARAILASIEHRRRVVTVPYKRLVKRDPAAALLEACANDEALQAGHSAPAVAQALSTPEATPAMGRDDPQRHTRLVKELVGRAVSPAQAKVGGAALLADRPAAIRALLESDEYLTRRQVPTWYRRYLRREPTRAEVEKNVAALHEGASEFELQAALLASDEYVQLQHCRPKTCPELGATCGEASDGCGGTVQCGECGDGLECGVDKPNVCGVRCQVMGCSDFQNACGQMDDGCGHRIECGVCPLGEKCVGEGVGNQCSAQACTPHTCHDFGDGCGTYGDGCGGLLDCGGCRS